MSARLLTAPFPQSGWNPFGAFCGWVGWSLSLLPQLTAAGYAVALGLGLAALAVGGNAKEPPRGAGRTGLES